MQEAETVLNVIRERGERGLPLENIYRCQPEPCGTVDQTRGRRPREPPQRPWTHVTGENRPHHRLANELASVNLPKPRPAWTDNRIGWGYEPQFSDRSQPDRGCHTALGDVVTHWTGVRWFVEGDIKGCFDNIDHDVLCRYSARSARQPPPAQVPTESATLRWKYGRALSGTPQGAQPHPRQHLPRPVGQTSKRLIPAHTRGTERRSVEQPSILGEGARAQGRTRWLPAAAIRPLRGRLRAGFHRAKGQSQADKGVLGNVPARHAQAGALSKDKTLITHATSQATRRGRGLSLKTSSPLDAHHRG